MGTIKEDDKHSDIFYAYWERVFEEMPDSVLESTIYMINSFDSLNDLAREQYDNRNCKDIY
jgi:hypothetical protein